MKYTCNGLLVFLSAASALHTLHFYIVGFSALPKDTATHGPLCQDTTNPSIIGQHKHSCPFHTTWTL